MDKFRSIEILQKLKENAVVKIRDLFLLFDDVNKINNEVKEIQQNGAETPALIKTKYESNPDTNAYTDAEKSKVTNVPLNTNTELSNKVDKIVGKQLSTEDYTTTEKSKLSGIQSGATANDTNAQLRDRSTHTGIQSGETVELAKIGNSTYKTIQDFVNFSISTGRISGGEISDAGSSTINISAGKGFIKTVDSNETIIYNFDWAASNGISIPSNTIRYIGIEYNAGSPQVIIKTSDSWDLDTEFPLGIVVNENGTLYILNIPYQSSDNNTNIIEKLDSISPIARDERIGGLILSVTGTRNIKITAGSLMVRMEEFPIPTIDTFITGNFDNYYRDGSGWIKQTGQTQFNVTQYDNGGGTLATMTTDYYSSRWFYLMTDGSIAMLYGQSEYVTSVDANLDFSPAGVPDRIAKMGLFIGRIVIQKGNDTPVAVQTIFGKKLDNLSSDETPTVVSGQLIFSNPITPSTLTTNTNNYEPTGLSDTNFLRLSSSTSIEITGLKAPSPKVGQVIYVVNIGANNISFKINSSSSNPDNRIISSGVTKTVQAEESIVMVYDPITSRWRIVSLAII